MIICLEVCMQWKFKHTYKKVTIIIKYFQTILVKKNILCTTDILFMRYGKNHLSRSRAHINYFPIQTAQTAFKKSTLLSMKTSSQHRQCERMQTFFFIDLILIAVNDYLYRYRLYNKHIVSSISIYS